jgi:predicted ATP-dependent serine protease
MLMGCSTPKDKPTLKSILLEQLRYTHTKKDWYPACNENNQETFTRFDKNQWQQTVHRLDSIQTLWEQSVEGATEAQLDEWSSSIANMCSHNAYHTGQIVYIRKKNGWWEASKGVK